MDRIISRTFSAIALWMLAACASAPRQEAYVAPPMGAAWTMQYRNAGSYEPGPAQASGKRVEVMWQGKAHVGFQGPTGTLVALPNGDWVGQLGPDGKPAVTWDPPLAYAWPLEVGKSWPRQYKVTTHATNQTVAVEARSTVEAYEEVSLPAGTFKAFRIRTTDNLGNDNVSWYAPETGIFVKQKLTRTAASPLGAGSRDVEMTNWSVPK